MEKVINIVVRNKVAHNVKQNEFEYICGNSDFIVVFDFDEEWDAFNVKTARFRYNGTYQDVVFEGNQCEMPIIENTHVIQVGVFAGNLHTTTPAEVLAKKSILCGSGLPAAPGDDVYAQLMEKISEVITSLNGKVTPEQMEVAIKEALDGFECDRVTQEQMDAAIAEALEGFEGGGGNSPIKPFPITKGVQPNYDLVVLYELEDNTFYYLDKNSHDKPVYFSANGQHILTGASYDYIYFNVRYASESISGSLRFGNQSIWYRADSNGEMIGTVNKMSNYLPITNDNPYTPTGDYYPATKKYVDDTTASVVADALANLEVGDVSLIKPFPTSETEYYTFVNVAELEDRTFYACPKTDKANMFRVEYGNATSVSVSFDAGEIYYHRSYQGGTTTPSLFYGFLHGQSSTIEYSVYSSGEHRIERKDYDNYLPKSRLYDENYSYTPTYDYNPATKKYVDDTVSEKISEIVFPEIPEPVQGDWNQNDPTADDYIKNRTHWVEGNGTNTLEWDGNTDGLALLSPDGETTLYKVTDFFVGKDDLVGGVISVAGVMDVPITADMIAGEAGDGLEMYQVAYNDTMLLLTVNQDLSMEGITLEKGTYLLSLGVAGYVSKVTLLTPAFGEEIVHKIDPKFLPEGGFGYDDTKELLPESSHTFTEEMDFMSPLSSALGLKVGESYTVVWNGTEYSCECVTLEMAGISCSAIGDANVVITGEPSGEYPFLIFDIPAEAVAQIGIHAAVMGLDGSESATVKVIRESIHTIDPKFLPGKVVYYWDGDSMSVTDANGNEITAEQAGKEMFNVVIYDTAEEYYWIPYGCVDAVSHVTFNFLKWGESQTVYAGTVPK